MKKKTLIIVPACFLAVAAAVFLVMSVTGKRGVITGKTKTADDIFDMFTSEEEASLERPNIVLIVVETLRADHASSYGYSRATTPQIDDFAKSAFRFTNCVSAASWTVPSHMSMFTGLYPSAHKVGALGRRSDEKITTLAKLLKKNGYGTAGFITNPLLHVDFGFARGFDFYDNFTVDLDVDYNLFASQEEGAVVRMDSRTSPALNKATLNWLKINHNKKFFLFVHYFDPHLEYSPRPPFDTLFDPGYKGKAYSADGFKLGMPEEDLEHVVALYDGEIRYTDEYIGALLKEFTNLGLKEKTLFIITADHGDEFLEHGGTGHGQSLYDELIRVPLIIKLPGASRKPAVINGLTSNVDFMPTICDYLKINTPKGVQGKSLLSEMNGGKGEERSYVFSESNGLEAIIDNGFKFIYSDNRKTELYNLKEDPGEKKNLIKTEPQKAAFLEKELTNFVNSSGKLASTLNSSGHNTVVIDEETKKKFKALGYMQ